MRPKTFWVIAAGTLLTVIYFCPLHLPLFRAAEEKKQELEEAENV